MYYAQYIFTKIIARNTHHSGQKVRVYNQLQQKIFIVKYFVLLLALLNTTIALSENKEVNIYVVGEAEIYGTFQNAEVKKISVQEKQYTKTVAKTKKHKAKQTQIAQEKTPIPTKVHIPKEQYKQAPKPTEKISAASSLVTKDTYKKYPYKIFSPHTEKQETTSLRNSKKYTYKPKILHNHTADKKNNRAPPIKIFAEA